MGLWEDLRFAARLLVKDKWFSLVAAVALALGIGVNAAVFTFVNAVLIRGLPIADPERTLAVDSWDRGRSRGQGVSYLDYRDWRENTKTFETFGAYSGNLANLGDEGQPPERYNGSYMSANAFSILGMRPVIGRDFVPDDDVRGASSVALIGHTVWVSRYGSNPSVIGKQVRINDRNTTRIGPPFCCSLNVWTRAWMSLLVSGFSDSIFFEMLTSSLCACWRVTPGAR